MQLRMPIGVSDFKELTTDSDPYTFIDKSLLIRDIVDFGAKVVLLVRPRRFGKTLNLSMLKYFFSCAEKDSAQLFDGLKIQDKGEKYANHQGKYPTIFITLKNVQSSDFGAASRKIAGLIAKCYRGFRYLLKEDSLLEKEERVFFQRIIDKEATAEELEQSLQQLSEFLHRYHGEKTLILIDEYDTPIHEAYFSKDSGYYKDMIKFMRAFLGDALKDDNNLYKGVLTGILRVAKESIFSELNNLKVYSLLNRRHGEHFGFTEDEVIGLLEKAGKAEELPDVKAWYNGYYVEELVLYNPWSIINYLDEGRLEAYWANTSANELIEELLTTANEYLQKDLTALLRGESITTSLNPHLNFKQLKKDKTAVLSLLYMSGYLNAIENPMEKGQRKPRYTLRIPNAEVYQIYGDMVTTWLSASSDDEWLINCLKELEEGRIAPFAKHLKEMARNVFSYFDTKGKEPEKFYHGLLLGIVIHLKHKYTIRSNQEAGDGRFDIALFPNNATSGRKGIIMAIKSSNKKTEKHLTQLAEKALAQIKDKEYQRMPEAAHIKAWTALGIAFSGKELKVAYA